MYKNTSARHALTASVALVMLGGCTGDGSQIPPAPSVPSSSSRLRVDQALTARDRVNNFLALRRGTGASRQMRAASFIDPAAAGKHLIFVTDYQSSIGFIDIYEEGGAQKMVGQIAGYLPAGLAVDTSRNLYVANSASVPIFAPPYTGAPTLTLSDPGYYASGVAVSSRGLVGVANICGYPSCNLGTANVAFYAKDSTTPCAVVAGDPAQFTQILYDTFDSEGSLYVTAFDQSFNAVIGEVKGGCSAKTIKPLTTTNTLYYPFGIRVDRFDRIAILNKGGSTYDTLDVYNRPKGGSLGTPTAVVDLVTPAYPIDFAFSESDGKVYTAEQGSGGLSGTYAYPAGGTAEKSIIVGGTPEDIAVSPPVVPHRKR
jgi:hypothetical protein